jgi:DNA-binding transcriptional regulator YiaG
MRGSNGIFRKGGDDDMARTLKDKLATLDAARRANIETETDRLHTEYLTLQDLRKARDLTQVKLAEALGVQQATVAKYERQSDILLSTLAGCVRAMGGNLKLVVEFPGKPPVALDGFGDAAEPGRRPRTARA